MNLERHFVNRIRQQAKTRQNATALRHKINGLWKDISWNAFQQQLDQLSLAFLACNIQVQDKIAIFAHNMSRWTIAVLQHFKSVPSPFQFMQRIRHNKLNLF